MKHPTDNGKLTKAEIEYLLRALRQNLKAAKTSILGLEPKLRAQFEQQLNTRFPFEYDEVWRDAFTKVLEQYKLSQAQVDRRCDELGFPMRFRPRITAPSWYSGGVSRALKDLRAELRRVAYMQIKCMVQERTEELERESANVQLEILAHGMITPVAQAFFDRLPKVEELIRPLSAEEVYGLMEGEAYPKDPNARWLPDRKKPEYLPDANKAKLIDADDED